MLKIIGLVIIFYFSTFGQIIVNRTAYFDRLTTSIEYDTNQVALSDTETVATGNTVLHTFRVPITAKGHLDAYIQRHGAVVATNVKYALATRSGNTMTLEDSSSAIGTVTANSIDTVYYGSGGGHISQDTIWVMVMFSGTHMQGLGNTGGSAVDYGYKTSQVYADFPLSSYTGVVFVSRPNSSIGIIVKN